MEITTERRAAPRFRVILPAICSRPGQADFYAVTDDVSTAGIRFRSAARLNVEERLTCRIRHIGCVETLVIRTDGPEFVARILTRRPAVDEFASKLIRVARRQGGGAREEVRLCVRVEPKQTETLVRVADGSALPARILDVSASGAGLRLERPPEIGQEVVIGRTPGRIVRHFEGGCGVTFLTALDPARVDAAVVL